MCIHEMRCCFRKGDDNIDTTILFGKYQLLSLLGTGSFGTVYLSRHLSLECYRAIKILPKSTDSPSTPLSEAQLLKSLQHPGIPILYDLDEDDHSFYLIEEYVEGESLDAYLLHQSGISLDNFYGLSLKLCNIFQYLHHLAPLPVLYLDLKPEHIIVCGTDIKLIDFNVATFLSKKGNICNLFGNTDFTAPELFQGAAPSFTSDIYSIGKIMQYLATFVDSPLPPNTQQLIHKAIRTEPAHRFETVDELILALNQQQLKFKQPHLRKSIAFFGSHRGCGTTHIAMSVVSALNHMGYSAVYYEKNSTDFLRSLQEYELPMKESNGLLKYRDFQGYPGYGPGIVLPADHHLIQVCDYGSTLPSALPETDLFIFVCSNTMCHRQELYEQIEVYLHTYGSLILLCNRATPNLLHSLAKRFGTSVYNFPDCPNPFLPGRKIRHFVTQLLQIKRRKHLFFHLENLFSPKK